MRQKSRIHVVTLGCPKNIVDSEHLLAHLEKNKSTIVDTVDDADTVVINTCGFIQDAKQESLDVIVEAIDKKKKGELKKIIVMGCLIERFKADLERELPEVDSFYGTHQLPDVLRILGSDYKEELLGERHLTTPSHYAYLKISEGCDNPCSFCAIPLMRGHHRSRPLKELVHEAQLLAEKGVKELILIGQDTTYYGLDLYGKRNLSQLFGELNSIDGFQWIRLMYAYPAKFPLNIIDAFHAYPKLCRYIDMPIQHISTDVLKSMQRGISERSTKELLQLLKKEIPDLALRTTLIVGFPTETEDDFEMLYDFVGEMRFDRLGVFVYSQEEGTSAFAMGDPVPMEIKNDRRERIMELQRSISEANNGLLVGKKLDVMVDKKEDGLFIGRTQWDAPEIDQEVIIYSNSELETGAIASATILDATEYDLEARVFGDSKEEV